MIELQMVKAVLTLARVRPANPAPTIITRNGLSLEGIVNMIVGS